MNSEQCGGLFGVRIYIRFGARASFVRLFGNCGQRKNLLCGTSLPSRWLFLYFSPSTVSLLSSTQEEKVLIGVKKTDQEVETAFFSSQETPPRLSSFRELETDKNRGKVVSWEFPTALPHFKRDKFQGMQEWSTKPEEACNCYPSRFPHLVGGIRTLIVLCAQWLLQLPLVECPHSALLRVFCSSDARHYS